MTSPGGFPRGFSCAFPELANENILNDAGCQDFSVGIPEKMAVASCFNICQYEAGYQSTYS